MFLHEGLLGCIVAESFALIIPVVVSLTVPGSPDIFANCHRCNDLLHSLLLLLLLIAVELCLELKDLPCAHKREKKIREITHRVIHLWYKRLEGRTCSAAHFSQVTTEKSGKCWYNIKQSVSSQNPSYRSRTSTSAAVFWYCRVVLLSGVCVCIPEATNLIRVHDWWCTV